MAKKNQGNTTKFRLQKTMSNTGKKKKKGNTDKNHLEKTINIKDRYSRVSIQNCGFREIQNETKKYLNLTSLTDYNDD